jgi:hypothetical protein
MASFCVSLEGEIKFIGKKNGRGRCLKPGI